MTTNPDPAAMTPDDRLAELAALLGMAYFRMLAARVESQKELEVPGDREAPCAPSVDTRENNAGRESA